MSEDFQKSFGGLTLRTCHSVGDFRQVVALQKEVWGFDDAELVPVRMFVVGEKIGGHVLAAFDGNTMVAYNFGIPGVRDGHAYIHSHMLAVRENLRNSGLGRALKLMQRELCLRQGFRLIEWTFDPLEIKNSWFNLERLGAVVRRYAVNQYGITASPLQGGLPTDRLVAEWWLDGDRVRHTLADGRPEKIEAVARVAVPAEVYAWKSEPETRHLAAEAQRVIRDAMQQHLAAGLAVTGYERDAAGNGSFLLGRWAGAEF